MGRLGEGETEGWGDLGTGRLGDLFEGFGWRFSPFFNGRCPKDKGAQKEPKAIFT